MITCKEDLINTYIENDHGELRDLYLAEGRRFGLYSEILKGAYTDEYVAIMPHCAAAQSCSKIPELCLGGQITLSDLKPTKQYAVLHKGGSYSFQSDRPIGYDVVACFDLAHSEKPLSEDFFDENRQGDKQMKTYNTYQEAKIANPDGKVYESIGGKFAAESDVSHIALCGCNQGWNECNPSDHCMTVEEFLKAGHEFEAGDLWTDYDGDFMTVGKLGVNHMNKPHERDFERYILRAAALEKPKRTKVEFVKVTDSIFDLKGEFEGGWLSSKAGGHYVNVDNLDSLLLAYRNDNVYRKVETEIDERQEFIDAACDEIGATLNSSAAEGFARLYDSGKFKLVN